MFDSAFGRAVAVKHTPSPPLRPTLKLSTVRGVVQREAPTPSPESFVVWADGRRGPRVRHPTKAAALAEAERLAALDPGRRMDVFGLVLVGRRLNKPPS